MTFWTWSTVVAFGLDAWWGDPRWLPHPVRGIGALVTRLEGWLYRLPWRKGAGALLLAVTICAVGGVAWLLVLTGRWMAPAVRVVWDGLLIWPALALRDLVVHGRRVEESLAVDDLDEARRRLSLMVSRDTTAADLAAVARGCIESVAENLVDGEISPLVFALVGGPVAVWMFKAVSTLDSMVGYRNERYEEFGWASARADDGLNYLPARLCLALLPTAAMTVGLNGREAWRTMVRDGGRNPSPNSGIPEAGMAGALGVELGGVNVYEGRQVEKPRLNNGARAPIAGDIARGRRLVLAASVVLLVVWVAAQMMFWKEMR